MTVTVKLSADLEAGLRRHAAAHGMTTSVLVREAGALYLAQAPAAPVSADALGEDLFGRCSGPPALVDSGPLLALFNAAEHWHQPVLTEACALLAGRIHHQAALDFLRWVPRGAVEVEPPEAGSVAGVPAIRERLASLPFDLAAASVAEAARHRRIRQVPSVDADFDVDHDKTGQPLANPLRR